MAVLIKYGIPIGHDKQFRTADFEIWKNAFGHGKPQ